MILPPTANQAGILLNKAVLAINQDITPQGRPVTAGDSTVWSRNLSDGTTSARSHCRFVLPLIHFIPIR
jgi:hypothetical protein